jgi:precorrin-3B methylase
MAAIVGTGRGRPMDVAWVRDVLQAATDWVGYSTYLDLAEPLREGQLRRIPITGKSSSAHLWRWI